MSGLTRHTFAKIILWTAIAWLCAATARADDFVRIDAEAFRVTPDGLPQFSVQLPLGNQTGADCPVVLEYPEYEPLSTSEVRIIKQKGLEVPSAIRVESYVGRSRKQAVLDVYFCPIVRQGGKWLRLVSCKLRVESPAPAAAKAAPLAAGAQADRYTDTSVLSAGKWVKIRVAGEGIYQLTDAQLKGMGFSDPARVKLYGYGGRILPEKLAFAGDDRLTDDLEEVPLYRRAGSVLFFAEGTVRWSWNSRRELVHTTNVYSSYSYYFLTEGDNPAAFATLPPCTSTPATVETTATGYALLDDDAFSWYQGGREFYDSHDFATGNTHTFKLSTPDAVPGGTNLVTIAFSAAHTSKSTTASISLGDTQLGRITVPACPSSLGNARERRGRFTAATLSDNNAFKFVTTQGNSARLNYIRVTYERKLEAHAAPFAISFAPSAQQARQLRIANAGTDTRLWRIGRAGVPAAEVATTLEGSELVANVEGTADRFVIADISKTYPSPEIVGAVENQNLHADAGLDMVIVVPPSGKLTAEAERMATAHRDIQGLRVKVVRADHIYNEYASGSPDATAIRRYMKMLYDRAASADDAPRYLLLFGDCAADNRMKTEAWRGYKPEDYLPSYEVNGNDSIVGTLYSYVTDDYFGLLDDGEGVTITREKVDLGIGRFTCHTAADAAVFVDKSIRYLRNEETGVWKNTIAMLGDDGDNAEHMKDADKVAKQIETQSRNRFHIEKYYWDAYKRTTIATGNRYPELSEKLVQLMEKGVAMMNYSGHGSPEQISHERVLLTKHFRQLKNRNLTMWVLASCEIAPYDSHEDNLCQAAMLNPDGGAIAFMCASRGVYATWNNNLNIAYCRHLLSSAADGRRHTMGDALRLAKNEMVDGADTGINKLKYVLIGNPAIPLATPTGVLQVDSIDGKPVAGNGKVELKAGAEVRFSGRALTEAGQTDENFTGTVTGRLFDRLHTVKCLNNTNDKQTFSYSDRGGILAETTDSIAGGRFALTFRVPFDISYSDDAGKLLLYAVKEDHSQENHCAFERFCLKGTAETAQADTVAPEVYVYLNSPDFPDGGHVGTSALFVAEVSDDCAINVSQADATHAMELSLDGNGATYALNDYFSFDLGSYKKGKAAFQLDNLTEGKHDLRFKVWDVNGNSTTARLRFTVGQGQETMPDINAADNPAAGPTAFVTLLDAEAGACDVTTEVYDIAGRQVWNHTARYGSGSAYATAQWNLTDSSGRALQPGIYMYRAVIRTAGGQKETKTKKLILLRN